MADDQLLEAYDWWMSGTRTLSQLSAELGITSGNLYNRFMNMGLPRKWEKGRGPRKGLSENCRYGLYIRFLLTH